MSHHDRLERFVGDWRVEAVFPPDRQIEADVGARATFEWILDGAFLVERSEVDHPDAPNGFTVTAPNADDDGYTQHYFDSRGVARIYEVTFDGRVWTLTRDKPDFSPLDFKQRYTATFDDDGDAIRGTWEICFEGDKWEKDFDLNYIRTP